MIRSNFFATLAQASLLLLTFSCDSNSKNTGTDPTVVDAAAVETPTDHKAGHGKGDAGHAPLDSASSENNVYLLSVEWSEPLSSGTLANTATLTFWEPKLHKAPTSLKSFKLFMPAMGHGSIKTDQLRFTQSPEDPAVWTVSNIYFSMGGGAGEWVVDVEAEREGRSDKVRVGVSKEVK